MKTISDLINAYNSINYIDKMTKNDIINHLDKWDSWYKAISRHLKNIPDDYINDVLIIADIMYWKWQDNK